MRRNKTVNCLTALILGVSLVLTGCGEAASASKREEFTEDTFVEPNNYEVTDGERELLPQVGDVVKYPYFYLCYSMESAQKEEYLASLIENGFKLSLEENVSEIGYRYYENDSKLITVADTKEVMIISITDRYDGMEAEDEAFKKSDVLTMIQQQYQDCIDGGLITKTYDRNPDILIKCWIPDLYTKANIQVYTTFTKAGKEAGNYFVSDDRAYKITDSLETISIADLDGNGTSELLSLYGFGSGIYRINLNVYQYANPVYFSGPKEIVHCCYSNCFVPKQGYGQLRFKKISDSEIHLIEVEEDQSKNQNGSDNNNQNSEGKDISSKNSNTIPMIVTADYGKLVVDKFTMNVSLESMDDFPYYEWAKAFIENQTTNNAVPDTDAAAGTKSDLTQVPDISVNISGQKLTTKSAMVNWAGKKEELISFSDLMSDDLPLFDCPDGYEFKDEICMSFADAQPVSIKIEDCLLTDTGSIQYGKTGIVDREVRYGDDGNYYLGLMSHFALFLSSNTASYTNPSYRGFRVTCEFDEEHVCEYGFVVKVKAEWGE